MFISHTIPILGGLLAVAAVALSVPLGGRATGAAPPTVPNWPTWSISSSRTTRAASRAKLVAACKLLLNGHEGTVSFATGTLAGDFTREVNDRDFDVSLHLVFVNKAAHDKYQEHPRHLKFVEENKENWEKVRVFDSYLSPAPRLRCELSGAAIGASLGWSPATSGVIRLACRTGCSRRLQRSDSDWLAIGSSRGRVPVGSPHADGERRPGRRLGRRVLGQLLQHDLDGLVELRVLARGHGGRVLLDVDIGRDAHVLDDPAVLGEDGQVGRRDAAAIHQGREAEDADQAAPGPLADQLAQAELAEHPRQQVAARAGRLVDDHDLGAEDHRIGRSEWSRRTGSPSS